MSTNSINVRIFIVLSLSIIISACTSIPEPSATAIPTNTVFPAIGKNISVALPEGNVDGGRALNG